MLRLQILIQKEKRGKQSEKTTKKSREPEGLDGKGKTKTQKRIGKWIDAG